MQGFTKGRSLRSRRQKGKGKQKFWRARMLKTGTFSPLFPFSPFSLASHAGIFRGARISSLPTREEIRAPLKTRAWEATFSRALGVSTRPVPAFPFPF